MQQAIEDLTTPVQKCATTNVLHNTSNKKFKATRDLTEQEIYDVMGGDKKTYYMSAYDYIKAPDMYKKHQRKGSLLGRNAS